MLHTRRNFLQLGSVSAATLALAPLLLASCASPNDYEAAANEIRRPVEKNGNKLRELVRLATLAPSSHNTQPWKFKIAADNIRIYPDLTRRIPAVDPDDRELWISLGSTLGNLLAAASNALMIIGGGNDNCQMMPCLNRRLASRSNTYRCRPTYVASSARRAAASEW